MLLRTGPRSLALTGEAVAESLSKWTSVGIRLAEVPGDNSIADLPSSSALATRTVFRYRCVKRLLWRELAAIVSKASPNSRIDPNSLGLESLNLLQLYIDHQNM